MSSRSRQRKIEYLARVVPPQAEVLLVGVSAGSVNRTENQLEHWFFSNRSCTALVYEQPTHDLPVRTVRGDARCLPFADGSFDYVVSNAVIEHVAGPPGARDMLRESARVARCGFFHSTPNRRFPIEVHTKVPLLHWAPHRWQDQVFQRFTRYRFPTDHYWLYTPRSARSLLPALETTRMGMFGMTFLIHGQSVDCH